MMAAMYEFEYTKAEDGLPVLQVLELRLPQAPRAYLRQLLRRGKIRRRCGTAVEEGTRLRAGDLLLLPASRRLEEILSEPTRPVPAILLETREVLAAYKPAGLAVHRAVGHEENLADWVQETMRRRREPFRTAPAHRLDVGTSGPVLFGKGKRAIAALGEAFRQRTVEKVYLALVSGRPDGNQTLTAAVPAKGKWKEAAAEFSVIATYGVFSLLEIRLHSGRTHQIRRQLAAVGHPVAGDRRYGGPPLAGLDRLFLHCRRLALDSPFADTRLEIDCPLPGELNALLRPLPHLGAQP